MNDNLKTLRQKIDEVDGQILSLLKNRIDLMKQIGETKKQNNLTIRDIQREKEKIEIMKQKAEKLNLPEQLINTVWTELFILSEKIEE